MAVQILPFNSHFKSTPHSYGNIFFLGKIKCKKSMAMELLFSIITFTVVSSPPCFYPYQPLLSRLRQVTISSPAFSLCCHHEKLPLWFLFTCHILQDWTVFYYVLPSNLTYYILCGVSTVCCVSFLYSFRVTPFRKQVRVKGGYSVFLTLN